MCVFDEGCCAGVKIREEVTEDVDRGFAWGEGSEAEAIH